MCVAVKSWIKAYCPNCKEKTIFFMNQENYSLQCNRCKFKKELNLENLYK